MPVLSKIIVLKRGEYILRKATPKRMPERIYKTGKIGFGSNLYEPGFQMLSTE